MRCDLCQVFWLFLVLALASSIWSDFSRYAHYDSWLSISFPLRELPPQQVCSLYHFPNCYRRVNGFLELILFHPGPQKDPSAIATAAAAPCPVKQSGFITIRLEGTVRKFWVQFWAPNWALGKGTTDFQLSRRLEDRQHKTISLITLIALQIV